MGDEDAKILTQERIDGSVLLRMTYDHFKNLRISFAAWMKIDSKLRPPVDTQKVSPNSPDTKFLLKHLTKEVARIGNRLDTFVIEKTSTPITLSEWYNKNNSVGIIPKWWEPYKKKLSASPLFATKQVRKYGESETKKVLPRWQKRLDALEKITDLSVSLQDCHDKCTIQNRKPDICGYLSQKPHNPFYLAIVGELKSGRKKSNQTFSDDEKGQLGSYLAKLKEITQRPFTIGFLSDGYIIQYFRFEDKLQETQIESLINNENSFLGFLCQSTDDMGFEFSSISLEGRTISIVNYLGQGGTSVVYEGQFEGLDVSFSTTSSFMDLESVFPATPVVKLYRQNAAQYLENEVQILKQLSSVASVPKLIGTIGSRILVTVPMGISLVHSKTNPDAQVKGNHFKELIKTLKIVHELNIVHRDIKLSNVYLNPKFDNLILLSDWSSASNVTEKTFFMGTPKYAPSCLLKPEIMNGTKKYQPQPKHDLEMVVKSIFLSFHHNYHVPASLNELQVFWEQSLEPPFWQFLLDAAENCNYEKMIELLSYVM
eukprot:TRINITY_DN9696_c0_g2_i4.p1 TRINITY_DN9696_c0_g2~~TRINITY_DN9696_c0_g2_i4.p1  ORF type:complete len:560 (+),score=110.36 TRINITY_DN9696_c0_g2_i4:55-1680(+)